MTIAAERIKLSTTRSVWWCTLIAAVLSLLLTWATAAGATVSKPLDPMGAAGNVALFGVIVLMILAAMTMTGEYRSGMIRTTFLATPNRTTVLIAKALVAAVFSAVCAAILSVCAIVLAGLIVKPQAAVDLSLTEPAAWRPVWAVAVYAALAAVLAVGVGALLRHAAAVVAVLILWPFVLELTLSGIPHLRDIVGPLLPFRNAFAFVGGEKGVLMWWGPWVSLLYFTGFVAVIFLAAAYVTNRRDP